MNTPVAERIETWLRQTPSVRGVLVRGVRLGDQTVLTDFDSRDYPATALEPAWRAVAETFQVLRAHGLPPRRLRWVCARAVLHCACHRDGMVLGAIVTRTPAGVDEAGLDRMFAGFLALEGAG